MRTSRLFAWAPIILLCLVLHRAPAAADISYTTVTRMELTGQLGKAVDFMAKLSGSSIDDIVETVHVKGNKMRTDQEENSTIIDLDEERFIHLNHPEKTYYAFSFKDAKMPLASALAASEAEPEETEQAPEESEVEVDFDFDVERTGKKEKVNGFEAEQVYLTVAVKATRKESEESEEQEVQEGEEPEEVTLVFAVELWMSDQVPGFEQVEAFQKRMAGHMGEVLGAGGMSAGGMSAGGMSAGLKEGMGAWGSDPQMQAGLEKIGAEISQIQGLEVKNTTHIVTVPAGLEFKRELVFAKEEKDGKKKKKKGFGGLGALAKKAMEAETGGEEEAEPEQKTVLTITSNLTEFGSAPLADALFAAPADYRELDFHGQEE